MTEDQLIDLVRWMAQTVHNAHHEEHGGTFLDCPKNTCKAAADAVISAAKVAYTRALGSAKTRAEKG
jgi:hypothetical protein